MSSPDSNTEALISVWDFKLLLKREREISHGRCCTCYRSEKLHYPRRLVSIRREGRKRRKEIMQTATSSQREVRRSGISC